ncbi:MAG: nucleoside monophosphate kinase [Holosporales bacterium]|jgi:adenylate kinase|nr:nucleoside monophosphate kinase [Holosporales bacterium]
MKINFRKGFFNVMLCLSLVSLFTACNERTIDKQRYESSNKWAVFIGCPGSGKGTQAEYLASNNGFIVIGMGDLLRDNKDMVATPDGKTLGDIMKEGKLVPASITVNLVEQKLEGIKDVAKKNVLFEGWPREAEQAKGFDLVLKKFGKKIDVVLNFVIQEEAAVKRIFGRYSCKKCGKIYNKFHLNPSKKGVCDVCGGKGFNVRADDNNKESLKNRFKTYNKETQSVINYYKSAGILCNIEADASAEEVRDQIFKSLDLKKESK